MCPLQADQKDCARGLPSPHPDGGSEKRPAHLWQRPDAAHKNASADLKHIAGLRHRFRIGIRRQLLSAFVEVLWLGHLFNRAGLELIGPLQIGVLVRRLIDGIGIGRFITRI